MEDLKLEQLRAELETKLKEQNKELKAFIEKANEQITNAGSLQGDTKAAIDKISQRATEITDRLLALEQSRGAPAKPEAVKSLGQRFLETEDFKAMQSGRAKSARMDVKGAIINDTGQNQPLVPADRRPGIIEPSRRRMTVRDLLIPGRTSSNLIEFAKELVFTNNAGPQYQASPEASENIIKPESNITFELASSAVVTLAHWIPASKQVLADSPMLQSYIEGRLIYGLLLEEEDELLNGDGTSGKLSGLLDAGNFTAYNRTQTGDTKIDTLRRAITQVSLSDYMASALVINPEDWEDIELTKTSDGAYVFSNPAGGADSVIWRKPVVATQSIASGTFLVGAFDLAAQVFDREEAAIEVSRENSDNFVKNMVTILAEERLALAVYRPAALVSGAFA